MIEKNNIYNMDCLEGMKLIPDGSIDCIITDIPYGEVNRKSNGLRKLDKGNADVFNIDIQYMLSEFNRICKGSLYIFCGMQQFSEIIKYFKQNNISDRCIVREKTNPSPINCQHLRVSGIELCAFGRKKGATYNGGYKNTVLRYPTTRKIGHTTPKNLNLFTELLLKSSNEGDIILDPFIGSGTTAIACINTNRNYIGFELDERYYNIAQDRIKNHLIMHLTSINEQKRS